MMKLNLKSLDHLNCVKTRVSDSELKLKDSSMFFRPINFALLKKIIIGYEIFGHVSEVL